MNSRSARSRIYCGVFLLCALLAPATSAKAESQDIYFVEEDWEVTIVEPATAINSPQISFFTFPVSSDESSYFQLQMNYAAEEWYSSGGFRVTAVSGEVPVDEERSENRKIWATSHDTIKWTTLMAFQDGRYYYAIKDGQSDDWGSFGGPDYLVEMPAAEGQSLIAYHPSISLDNVDVGFGANRVASIRLKKVRVYYHDGHVETVWVNGTVDLN